MTMLPFSLLFVSLATTANCIDSFITLPISKRVNLTGTETLVSRDLARINYLQARATGLDPVQSQPRQQRPALSLYGRPHSILD